MNNFLLTLLDLFQWLFRLMKADYQQLRAIVNVKLIMDNRRQLIPYKRKESKDPGNSFLWTVFFYGLFGIVIAIVLYGVPSFIVSMIMFYSYIMVMIAMTLITDFSSILLDTSDNTIILPRPVDGRTVFIARIVHILLYLGLLTIGLSAFPAVVVLLKYGVVLFGFFIAGITLSVILTVALTNGVYLLIMQFSSEEKLKNVINYFQIFMAVFIMFSYQILPRMIGRFDLEDFVFEVQWWSYLVPPVWIAGALEAYYLDIFDVPHVIFITLALIMPILGFYLVNQYLTPVFTRKLGAIGTSAEPRQKKSTTGNSNFINRISAWITGSAAERGSFQLVYNILGRDRKIKLKIYPSFGYMIIFGLIFLLQGRQDFMTTWNNLPDTQYHLMLVYLTFMILQIAFYEIPYSDDFKASWIYFSAPLENPGEVLSGSLKAIFVRLFIPGYMIISAIVLGIWGVSAIDDIVFGFFNNFIMLLLIALINKRSFPLSLEPSVRNQAGSFMRSVIMLLLLGALGFGHFILSWYPVLMVAAIPAQIIAIYYLLRYYKDTSWTEITA